MTPLWIGDMEAAARDVLLGKVPRQTDFLCLGNDGKFYRPIIARNEHARCRLGGAFLEPSQSPSRKRSFADSRPDAPHRREKSGLVVRFIEPALNLG
ncbi:MULTISPECIES: hypothetical protein [unclassified Bradyrhizobium]|uniref:hypothetical protein n=1 Tax=unclassified Bradyrhizobium TaxID=2631580 RepID=UPI002916E077|nr:MULTISPECIES: hypothetical protein [unclassified Bradyrhizobium]